MKNIIIFKTGAFDASLVTSISFFFKKSSPYTFYGKLQAKIHLNEERSVILESEESSSEHTEEIQNWKEDLINTIWPDAKLIEYGL